MRPAPNNKYFLPLFYFPIDLTLLSMSCLFLFHPQSAFFAPHFFSSTSYHNLQLPSLSCHQMKCCGWTGPGNWSENLLIKNSTQALYSCSCRNDSRPGTELRQVGLCERLSAEPPVYETVRNTVSKI